MRYWNKRKGAATMTNQRKKTKFSAFINFFLFCLFCLFLFLTKSIFEKTPFFSKFFSFNFLNWFLITINSLDICFLCWFENLDALEGKDNKILWKKAVINNFIKNINGKILSFVLSFLSIFSHGTNIFYSLAAPFNKSTLKYGNDV
jgi:hypothetical protein